MPRITLGNKLYLYDLFAREMGIGKQTMLARVEEVLAADDIMPCDLECADVRELLEKLGGFVRLTVFKKGRVYATVIDQPEWNEILDKLASEADNPDKAPANVGGPKAWKRKKSRKDPRPAKPRPFGRPEATDEAEEAAEPEGADVLVMEQVSAPDDTAETLHTKAVEDTDADQLTEVPAEAEGDVEEPATPVRTTRVRRRRHVVGGAEQDASVTAEARETEDTVEPVVPEEPATSMSVEESAPQEIASPTDDTNEVDETPEEPEMAEEAEEAVEETEPEAEAEPELELEPEPEPTMRVVADMLPATFWDPVPAAAPRGRRMLPNDFVREVVVSNEALRALYGSLPWDTNPLEFLSKSWDAAQETRSYVVEAGVVSFELATDEADEDSPRVSMRPMRPTTSGKRWRLV